MSANVVVYRCPSKLFNSSIYCYLQPQFHYMYIFRVGYDFFIFHKHSEASVTCSYQLPVVLSRLKLLADTKQIVFNKAFPV
jgi:hypothetical protein